MYFIASMYWKAGKKELYLCILRKLPTDDQLQGFSSAGTFPVKKTSFGKLSRPMNLLEVFNEYPEKSVDKADELYLVSMAI